ILADTDHDGVPDASDCAPSDPSTWAVPGEVTSLVLSKSGNAVTLNWQTPASPGGTLPLYDTVRSTSPSDFTVSATCVETRDGSDLTSSDPTVPTGGFYYLVRAENVCGLGSAGTTSANAERVVASCP